MSAISISTNLSGYSSSIMDIIHDSFSYSSDTRLYVYKGAVPTESEFNESTDTVQDFRSSDRLLTVNLASATIGRQQGPGMNELHFTVYASYTRPLAEGGGLATWWVLTYHRALPMNTTARNFIGDVGLNGSGASLIMHDTTIVSGQEIVCPLVRIAIPVWL